MREPIRDLLGAIFVYAIGIEIADDDAVGLRNDVEQAVGLDVEN
jgi:hypothetical protein